jgi:hypothetical protein
MDLYLFILIAIIYLGAGIYPSSHMHDNSRLYYSLTENSFIFTWLLWISWLPVFVVYMYNQSLKTKPEGDEHGY